MSRLTAFALATLVAVAPAAAQNAAQDLAPGVGAGKVLRAQLAIKSPTTTQCPTTAKMTGWVFTDFAGKVQVMIARKGQSVGTPFQVSTVPAANGQHMATFNRNIQIVNPIDAEYRILVGGGAGVVSNWAPLKASCAMGAGPANEVQGG